MQNPLHTFKYLVMIAILVFAISCRTLYLDQNVSHTGTKTPVALGMIGLQEGMVLSSRFEVTTIPSLDQKIRVLATKQDFCKSTYKKYSKASSENKQQVTYVDSLEQKPAFVKLQIIDKLAYKKALEDSDNQMTMAYLKTQKDAHVVTAVSIAFSIENMRSMEQADVVFLINKKQKQYSLELVKNEQPFATIDFTEGTIFGYELSRFCWGVDKRNNAILSDIVDQNTSCPGDSYKDAAKAEERNATTYKL